MTAERLTASSEKCAKKGPNHFMQTQRGGRSICMFTFWSMLIFNFYCQTQVETKRSLIVLLKNILNDVGLIILIFCFGVKWGPLELPRPPPLTAPLETRKNTKIDSGCFLYVGVWPPSASRRQLFHGNPGRRER